MAGKNDKAIKPCPPEDGWALQQFTEHVVAVEWQALLQLDWRWRELERQHYYPSTAEDRVALVELIISCSRNELEKLLKLPFEDYEVRLLIKGLLIPNAWERLHSKVLSMLSCEAFDVRRLVNGKYEYTDRIAIRNEFTHIELETSSLLRVNARSSGQTSGPDEVMRLGPIRIFCGHLDNKKNGKRGRPPIWDREKFFSDLIAHAETHGPFGSETKVVNFGLESGRIKLLLGCRPPEGKKRDDPPDRHTIKAWIKKRKIDKIPGVLADT